MNFRIHGRHLSMLGLLTAVFAAGCASFTTYGDGFLEGHVLIRWYSQDQFIFIPDKQAFAHPSLEAVTILSPV